MKVSSVIVNYGGWEDTRVCVEALRRATYPTEIIVVDNASPGDDVAALAAFLQPGEQLVVREHNGGYAAGCNTGMQRAFAGGANAVLLLNNDAVVDPACIAELVETMQADPTVGIVGPKILSWGEPDVIYYAGILAQPDNPRHHRLGYGQRDSDAFQAILPTYYQDGCALLISRDCYRATGGFDETLWSYWEDTDLCIRARQAGFQVLCDQRARVWHKISASFGSYYQRTPLAVYFYVRNQYIFYRRYTHGLQKLRVIGRLLARIPRALYDIVVLGRRNRAANTITYALATWEGLFSSPTSPGTKFSPLPKPELRKI